MKKKIINSIFSKMTISFIALGIMPILIFSQVFLVKYAKNMEEVMIGHMEQMLYYVSKNMEEIFQSVNDSLSSTYEYSFNKYTYLYDLLKDKTISEEVKTSYINEMLNDIVNNNDYISAIRFKTIDGTVYSVYKERLKNLRNDTELANELKEVTVDDYRKLFILPAFDESKYCSNSNDYMFTMARNYMDCSSLENTKNIILGTFYADINIKKIESIASIDVINESREICIINVNDKKFLYSSNEEDYSSANNELKEYDEEIYGEYGYILKDNEYAIYSNIGDTDYYVIKTINKKYILANYFTNRFNIITIIFFGLFLIFLTYLKLSSSFNKPVKDLKNAMNEIQKGNLDTRVNINTNDEMQYLGEGFNKMAEDLNRYINQVYKALLAQKDAELKALKMQIKPHYLYNTLDVIRMKAIEHEDIQVAELLESLSKQLRYLINNKADYVTIEDELNNIKEYFFIISVRYNGLYKLEINVKDECLKLMVPKLILQPIVENAVKYGLRGQKGPGKVRININKTTKYFEIMIMDNGIGISDEKKEEIDKSLLKESENIKYSLDTGSIGIKNIYNRIKYCCGTDFEFKIEGERGFGTIVTYRLPIVEEDL